MKTRTALIIIFIIATLYAPSTVHAQAIGVALEKKSIGIDEQASATVFVTSPAQAMNAVSGTLSFPATIGAVSIQKEGSIIDLWTEEPHIVGNRIRFEGIVLNPGYQGSRGELFRVTFIGKKAGAALLSVSDGAVLANDGLGSNIVSTLGSASLAVVATPFDVGTLIPLPLTPGKRAALPVITDYAPTVDARGVAFVKGKGEPGALTKIVFADQSFKSIGEQFIAALQTKRKKLDSALVRNDPSDGSFEYLSPHNLVAGSYSATPFLVDAATQSESPGLGVRFLVSDSPLVRILVVVINVLALLIPVVGLIVVIYFIPWYSFRRMRVIGRKMGIEEEKLDVVRHRLRQEDAPPGLARARLAGPLGRSSMLIPHLPQAPFPMRAEKKEPLAAKARLRT